jgi:hypothetical protein
LLPLNNGICTPFNPMTGASNIEVCQPTFVAKISQSYPWPGCGGQTNTITVTLRPNARVLAPSTITMYNLFGAVGSGTRATKFILGNFSTQTDIVTDVTPNITTEIDTIFFGQNDTIVFGPPVLVSGCFGGYFYNDSSSTFSLLIGSNELLPRGWFSGDGTCRGSKEDSEDKRGRREGRKYVKDKHNDGKLDADQDIDAKEDIVFSFVVINSMTAQPQQDIMVASDTPLYKIAKMPFQHDQQIISRIQAAKVGDAAGLVIHDPDWVMASISQGNPYPVGSATPDGMTALTGPVVCSGVIHPTGKWTKSTGTLMVFLIDTQATLRKSRPVGNLVFSFTLKNPTDCQPSPTVYIAAELADSNCGSRIPIAGTSVMNKSSSVVGLAGCRACGDKSVLGEITACPAQSAA